ncbi:MAG: EAL domain-containing protein [Steroidobacteraceae bacterium]
MPRQRVLCVDDEPQVLRGLELQLGRHYQVLSATNGADALRLLERDPTIDVVISDMRMPGMSGAGLLAEARRVAPRAARILLTGQTDVSSASAAVNEGQIHCFLTKPCPPSQLHQAVATAVERARENSVDHSGIRRSLAAELVNLDVQTGLASRARFRQQLATVCAEHRPCALLLLNLDNLREINSAQGQVAGDHVIVTVARRLQQQCERALCLARWAGDEFAVLLPAPDTDPTRLGAVADVLIAVLSIPVAHGDALLRPLISVGVTHVPGQARDAEAAVRNAGIAAHEAKLLGGGASCLFRPDAARRSEQRFRMLTALREAIDTDRLELHFQPIIDLQRRRVRSLEALLRWHHPEFGQVPPSEFIPLAEESGEMPRLGNWVLRRACMESRSLVGQCAGAIAVNVSMQQLLNDAFLTHVDDALRLSGMSPATLELELTESVFSRDTDKVLATMDALHARGVRIAIDDFGTGYSSLAYLQRMPADAIKVDRCFTANLGKGGETILAAALSIGRSFGMEVIIEGVENDAALGQLQSLGAHLFQGYLFGRPMPATAVAGWLAGAGFGPDAPWTAPASATATAIAPATPASAAR